MKIAPKNVLVILFFALALAVGCGGGNSSPSNQINITGNWQFTFASIHGEIGTGSGMITQSGSSFSGTLALTSNCATSGTISGTISGTALTATLDENGQAVSLSGTVASTGSSTSGTYTAAAGGCTNGDTGTWSAARIDVSGSFAGTINPADLLPVGISLRLEDENGIVSGSAFFTHSVCFSSMTLSGKAVGSNIDLEGSGFGGTIVLRATLDTSGKSLSLQSEVSGSCQAESGTGTITKVTQ